MIVIYRTIPNAEIRKDAATAIGTCKLFFQTNPKRKVANVGVWYGKMVKVRRGHIVEDINAARDAALK